MALQAGDWDPYWGAFYIPARAQTGPMPSFNFSDSAKTAATGAEVDDKFYAQLIGKDIPIFVGGQALLGCRIAEGAWLREEDGAGLCNMIVTCAVACVPGATREIRYLNLNGTKTFESSDGGETWAVAAGATTDVFDDVEINVLYGTETQTPLASSISRFGARAVPYRSHICVELLNVPLAPFNNMIPFVSAYVYESDFITRTEALLRLAEYSRFNRTTECEIEVSDQDPFWIVIRSGSFPQYVQDLQRTVGRNWNFVPGDKLRITETPSTVVPIEITRADVAEDSIQFRRADPLSIPAVRTMGFIDTGRDNDFNSVKAVRSRFPIALTASEDTEDLDIPIGMEAIDAKAIVNRSLLIDDIARNQVTFKALSHMRGLVAGDVIFPNFSAEIEILAARIISVDRKSADWTTDIVAEEINLSLLAVGPSITSNGGAGTASISVDEGDTAVTTVTADDADEEDAFSISGGDDAAFFAINADTGVLTFLVAPDYEDPQDDDTNNTYVVVVEVLGNGLTDTQTITVTVSNVADGGPSGSLIGFPFPYTQV